MTIIEPGTNLDGLITKGLCKLRGGGWALVNRGSQTTVIIDLKQGLSGERRFNNVNDVDALGDALDDAAFFSVSDLRSRSETVVGKPASKIPRDQIDQWCQLAHSIDEEPELATSPLPTRPKEPASTAVRKTPIPITALRHLYNVLRGLSADEVHAAISRYLADSPKGTKFLRDLYKESVSHFCMYSNIEEHFRPEDSDRDRTLDDPQEKYAIELVQAIRNHGCSIAPGIGYDYVDYEISPLRTTKALYENGRTGRKSGAGGIDVLLATKTDRTPVVGEIKAETDTNPFLAFIQALTYASELATQDQQTRLKSHYQEFAERPDRKNPTVELMLFLEPKPNDDKQSTYLTQVKQLIRQMYSSSDSTFARTVTRVCCVEARLLTDGPPDCSLVFDCSPND
jgi:hypothetical protein